MARTYSALFKGTKPYSGQYLHPVDGHWSVIFKDDDDDCWYVELDDAQDRDTAQRITEALNLREKEHARP